MNTLKPEVVQEVSTQNIMITEDTLTVKLTDGRSISVPLTWYPRLLHGTQMERNNWRLIGNGEGIHWPELDEDISVENLVLGRRSGEVSVHLSNGWRSEQPTRDESRELLIWRMLSTE